MPAPAWRRIPVAGLFLLAAVQPAIAQERPPLPRPKPVALIAIDETVPLPRSKPSDDGGDAAQPARSIARFGGLGTGRWPKSDVAEARALCAKLLAGRRLVWIPEPPLGARGGCGTAQPILVRSVAGVEIDPPATLTCPMAAAVHDWITQEVQPAARKHVGSRLTSIVNASSYACRRRNNGRRGKISEHGFANALDVADFRFGETRVVSVAGHWSGFAQSLGLSGRGNFLRTVRKNACRHFNTILGPGSDAHHKDHLHLDLMKLRPGRFKMCR